MTQCDKIIRYIKDFGSITTMQAFQDLGVTRAFRADLRPESTRVPHSDRTGFRAQQIRREGTLF